MEENLKNKLGFWIFFIIVLTLLIGGFIFTKYTINEDKNKKEREKIKIDLRIDKNKDYIYYINEETISESAEIYYKDVVINLSTQEVLTESLEKENKIYKNNIKHISEMNIMTDQIIKYNNDDLYALTFRDYKNYEYGKYVSLVVNDYNYSCFDDITFKSAKAYVFDTEDGTLLTNDDLLNKYIQNVDTIKEKVREYLNSKQTVVDDAELIKIDETIDNLGDYTLYIDEYGHLAVSFLVKTTQVDYNEIMEVN